MWSGLIIRQNIKVSEIKIINILIIGKIFNKKFPNLSKGLLNSKKIFVKNLYILVYIKTHTHVLAKNLRKIICKSRISKNPDSKDDIAVNTWWIHFNMLRTYKSKNVNSIVPTLKTCIKFNNLIKINLSFWLILTFKFK